MTFTAPELIATQIRHWDCKNVANLRDMLREFAALRDESGDRYDLADYGIDMADLPSEPFPSYIDTSWPAWAMDSNFRVLVGSDFDVVTLAELDEMQNPTDDEEA